MNDCAPSASRAAPGIRKELRDTNLQEAVKAGAGLDLHLPGEKHAHETLCSTRLFFSGSTYVYMHVSVYIHTYV